MALACRGATANCAPAYGIGQYTPCLQKTQAARHASMWEVLLPSKVDRLR